MNSTVIDGICEDIFLTYPHAQSPLLLALYNHVSKERGIDETLDTPYGALYTYLSDFTSKMGPEEFSSVDSTKAVDSLYRTLDGAGYILPSDSFHMGEHSIDAFLEDMLFKGYSWEDRVDVWVKVN